MPDIEEMGPVDYLVVEFPKSQLTGEAFPLLVDLVDRGIIRILDLVFVRRDTDGLAAEVAIGDLVVAGNPEVAVFEGAASGLLGPDDVEAVGAMIEPGSTAAILVFENAWAAPLAVALRRAGGQLVADARIPIQGLIAALDAAEAADAKAAAEAGTDTAPGATLR
jgi:hypothetical protein